MYVCVTVNACMPFKGDETQDSSTQSNKTTDCKNNAAVIQELIEMAIWEKCQMYRAVKLNICIKYVSARAMYSATS